MIGRRSLCQEHGCRFTYTTIIQQNHFNGVPHTLSSRRQTASALAYLRYATNTNLKASSAYRESTFNSQRCALRKIHLISWFIIMQSKHATEVLNSKIITICILLLIETGNLGKLSIQTLNKYKMPAAHSLLT